MAFYWYLNSSWRILRICHIRQNYTVPTSTAAGTLYTPPSPPPPFGRVCSSTKITSTTLYARNYQPELSYEEIFMFHQEIPQISCYYCKRLNGLHFPFQSNFWLVHMMNLFFGNTLTQKSHNMESHNSPVPSPWPGIKLLKVAAWPDYPSAPYLLGHLLKLQAAASRTWNLL